MFVPKWMLAVLVLLALPTVVFALGLIDGEMRRRGRCLIGNVDDFRDDHTYTIDTHLLYFRVWRRNGFHSTAWLD